MTYVNNFKFGSNITYYDVYHIYQKSVSHLQRFQIGGYFTDEFIIGPIFRDDFQSL